MYGMPTVSCRRTPAKHCVLFARAHRLAVCALIMAENNEGGAGPRALLALQLGADAAGYPGRRARRGFVVQCFPAPVKSTIEGIAHHERKQAGLFKRGGAFATEDAGASRGSERKVTPRHFAHNPNGTVSVGLATHNIACNPASGPSEARLMRCRRGSSRTLRAS